MKVIFKYILLFLYFFIAFFLMGLVVRVVISFIYTSGFYLSCQGVFSNFVKSAIAGLSITVAAIVFNLIDKYNARKSPPSDPE